MPYQMDSKFFMKIALGVIWWIALWGIFEIIIEHYTKRSVAMRLAFYVTMIVFVIGVTNCHPELEEIFTV
jgi:predicted membrane channel-forming protein YqfA (hemolysin III family)